MKPITQQDCSRKLLPLKNFPQISSVFSFLSPPCSLFPLPSTLACPLSSFQELPKPFYSQGLLGVWRDDPSALYKGLQGSCPYPRGGPHGDVTGEAGRAVASRPPPPSSLPASQVVASCPPDASISEEQRARWADFPGAPRPASWGRPLLLPLASISLKEVGTAHSCAQQTALVCFMSSQYLQKAGELEASSDMAVLLIHCGTFLVQIVHLRTPVSSFRGKGTWLSSQICDCVYPSLWIRESFAYSEAPYKRGSYHIHAGEGRPVPPGTDLSL